MNTLDTVNQSLFLLINADNGTAADMIQIARICAEGLIYLIPLLLVYLWFCGDRNARRVALLSLLVILVGLLMNQLIGLVYFHPRPFMSGDGHTWLAHAPETSFPSDHMTVFMCTSLTLLTHGLRRAGWWVFGAGLVVAWSRVFLGVHYPMDMLGALLVAALSLGLASLLWRNFDDGLVDFAERVQRRVFSWVLSLGGARK